MDYRSIPLFNGSSPAELHMEKKFRSRMSKIPEGLEPSLPNKTLFRKKDEKHRVTKKKNLQQISWSQRFIRIRSKNTYMNHRYKSKNHR